MTPMNKAVAAAQSQGKLARLIGVSRQRVGQLVAGDRIPAELAIKIEQATNGAVTRADLRPDLWGERAA